jgi:hypothetical protein
MEIEKKAQIILEKEGKEVIKKERKKERNNLRNGQDLVDNVGQNKSDSLYLCSGRLLSTGFGDRYLVVFNGLAQLSVN